MTNQQKRMMSMRTNGAWILYFAGVLLFGITSGCGSSAPVVGADVDRRVYLLKGEKVAQAPEIDGGYGEVERLKKYPEAAERDNAYGVIWVQCTISARGVATRLQVVEGGHPALETEALNVVQRLRFKPARMNNAPVQARVQIPIIFQGPYARPQEGK